jgi:hypothetical protein
MGECLGYRRALEVTMARLRLLVALVVVSFGIIADVIARKDAEAAAVPTLRASAAGQTGAGQTGDWLRPYDEAREVAEAAVAAFHTRLNHGDFGAIYHAAHPDLRRITSELDLGEQDFAEFLAAIQGYLGQVESTVTQRSRVEIDVSTVTLTHETTFTAGTATETFIFRMEGDNATLRSYRIDSPTLPRNDGTRNAP